MRRIVVPSKVNGEIPAPPSKSITQRTIAAGLLSDGETIIYNPSYCDDAVAAMSIATGLGAKVEPSRDKIKISGSTGLRENKIHCGESGLAARMFSPIASLFPEEIIVNGSGSLKNRPLGMIEEALNQFGVSCETNNGFLPIKLHGPLKGGKCTIDGSLSSQILTGLMMALPIAEGDSEVEVTNLKSKPYIDMTLKLIDDFGVEIRRSGYNYFWIKGNQRFKAREYSVESDWSGGAFLLVAGAINGPLRVKGLSMSSQQSDKAILTALDKAGAKMVITGDYIEVYKSEMISFEFDATDAPDLFPPLAVLAAYCNGTSAIKGVNRLINKESNRSTAIVEEFSNLGVKVEIVDDYMLITGGPVSGGKTASRNDHRIAMALAVLALKAGGEVHIKDSHAVSKSYPTFFDDLRSIGVKVIDK
ncbi:MAG: 3-phosphoshikimate 1-carboxyvinyltransferase [Bacteroidales bacterium]|jgi:3-phosphoshikimate 1-carboxyvinyltransferase